MKHIHELFFGTEAEAYAAHTPVVRLVGRHFLAGQVQEGGQRTSRVMDQKPAETWRFVFTTTFPLNKAQMDQIHQATEAAEGTWNRLGR